MMTNDIIDSDGFRANVGIVLMRRDGTVFLGRRTGGKGWQFPQGGVREGERLEQALYRELREEIGLAQADVEIVGRTAHWLRYRLPPRYIRRNRHPLCVGQKQHWFLLRLAREPVAFDFTSTGEEPEFDEWRWTEFWEPVREVIYFKRKVYRSALVELAPAAFPAGQPARPAWWNTLTRASAGTTGASGGA
jgi:putative (di)nucleoside polyphosphate hydrolase